MDENGKPYTPKAYNRINIGRAALNQIISEMKQRFGKAGV